MDKIKAKQLEVWRKGLKLSQAAIAKKVGIAVAEIRAMESGEREVSSEVWAALDQLHDQIIRPGVAEKIAEFKKKEAKPLGDLVQKDLDTNSNGAALSSFRKGAGITQGALADLAGVSQALVSQIENGERPFTEESGTALWNALFVLHREKFEKEHPYTASSKGMPGIFETQAAFERIIFPSPEERIKALERLCEAQEKNLEAIKKLIDLDAVNFLMKRMDEMQEQLTAFAELNGLRMTQHVAKSEADAAAEKLQEQLLRREKETER